MRSCIAALVLSLGVGLASAAERTILTERQIDEAIALGKANQIPIARIRTFTLDMVIDGPVARIAAVAAAAFRLSRAFTPALVTAEMKQPIYRVSVRENQRSGYQSPLHTVLMAKVGKGTEVTINPIRETAGAPSVWQAQFDRLPDGEFTVLVHTDRGPQRIVVSAQDRSKVR